MAIVKKDKNRRRVIDLTGPQGNVFYLMGQAKDYARALDLDGEAIVAEMMKCDDYEHAVQVFDKYFGDFVDLER
jgi:hypothetical protein